jgi:hypothetical protein
MNESNKTVLIIAIVVVVILFLIFGFGTMSGSFMGAGGMMDGGTMGDGTIGQGRSGAFGWMWIPTLITLGIGLFLGWVLFAKKR